jgi:hypothetical protein
MPSYRLGSHPKNSDFNIAWRRALRSKRFAGRRRRIRELRASTRVGEPSASRVGQILELKLLEGWLGLQKISLKIRRFFR